MPDQTAVSNRLKQHLALATLIVMSCLLIWGYWNTLREVAREWDNPKYSHGYLVPLFTAVLLWLRRGDSEVISPRTTSIGAALAGGGIIAAFGAQYLPIIGTNSHLLSGVSLVGILAATVGVFLLIGHLPSTTPSTSARWTGLSFLATGLALRLVFTQFPNVTGENGSFVIGLLGLFLMVGGWPTFRWAAPALLFLVFMFPLPSVVDTYLLQPLQKLAAISSSYVLQTIGLPAHPIGDTIQIGEMQLEVVEACSGLRMLNIFIGLSVAVTMITARPIWERIVIILSSVPIALASNVVRITITGLLHLFVGRDAAKMFHDQAGWVMMPLALGMLYLEMIFLSNLVVEDTPIKTLPIGMDPRGPRPAGATVRGARGVS